MRQFSCGQCRSTIIVHDEELGTKVVCGNCNTRQPAPLDATVATLAQPPYVPPPKRPYVPEYLIALAAGHGLMIGGAVTIIAAFILAFSPTNQGATANLMMGLAAALSGLAVMGLGQLLHCVRDLAQHSWQNRARQEGTPKSA